MSDRLSLSQVAALMAYAATTAGGQLLFKTPALRGAGDGPLAERIAGFLLNDVFFRCAHSLRRADRSVGLDPELYPALARLSVPRLHSRSRQRLRSRQALMRARKSTGLNGFGR